MNIKEKRAHLRRALKDNFKIGSVMVHYQKVNSGVTREAFAIQGNYLTLWISKADNIKPPYSHTVQYEELQDIFFLGTDPERFL